MKLFDALNDQMNFELESAYLYQNMAAYLEDEGMGGMTHFMNKQVGEEIEHAQKMIHFLQENNYRPVYRSLDPGDGEFSSLLDVFEKALVHEKEVTARINKLADQAREEGNHKVYSFLQWYVDEQVEEENSFNTIIQMMERAGSNWGALYLVDGQLASR